MPGLSVIVAGATGATGREVVAKLVAHPEVGRVVALTRFEISFDKWPLVFPSLKMGDALRHLSVVPINWDQLTKSAAVTPPGAAASSLASSQANPLPTTTARNSSGATISVPPTTSPSIPIPPLTMDNQVTSKDREDPYKGIFSGHDVAICCLGSRSLFNSKELATVDYNYTLAFAKMVAQYGTPPSMKDVEQQRNASVSAHIRRLSLPPSLVSEILSALSCDTRHLRPSTAPLRKAIFLSTSRASPSSWIPYFRMHGICDEELKNIFQCQNRTVVVESESTASDSRIAADRSRGNRNSDRHNGSDESNCGAPACPASSCGLPTTTTSASAGGPPPCNPFPINLQIWRTPLLVRRSESRWIEAALTRFTPSVDSDVLADLIVERALRGLKEEGMKAARGVPACLADGSNGKNTCEVLTSTDILESAQVLLRTM
jgi:hypothetical protein